MTVLQQQLLLCLQTFMNATTTDDDTCRATMKKPPNQRMLYCHRMPPNARFHFPPQCCDHSGAICGCCSPPPAAPHMSKPLLSPNDIPPSSPPCAPPAVCFAIDFLAFRAVYEKRKQKLSKQIIEGSGDTTQAHVYTRSG